MTSTALQLIACVVAGIVVWAPICRFGFFIDDKIDDDLRKRVYQLLCSADRNTWPEYFVSLFDQIFSPTRAGRPSFRRSALVSCLSIAVVTVVWVMFQAGNINLVFEDIDDFPWHHLTVFIPYAICVNVVGDYFSLWETRFIVGRMAKRAQGKHTLVLLFVDLFVSGFIFVVGLILGSAAFLTIWLLGGGKLSFFGEGSWFDHLLALIIEIMSILLVEGGFSLSYSDGIEGLFGVFLYTTFFTSVWIWAFLFGITFLPIVARLSRVFKVERYPVGTAMCVGGAAIGVVVSIVGFAMLL